MPKTPTKHRTVRTWINGVLRETLESENQEVRVTEPKVNTEMAVGGDPMEAIIQRMEQLEMENARNAAWRRDIEAKDKEENSLRPGKITWNRRYTTLSAEYRLCWKKKIRRTENNFISKSCNDKLLKENWAVIHWQR